MDGVRRTKCCKYGPRANDRRKARIEHIASAVSFGSRPAHLDQGPGCLWGRTEPSARLRSTSTCRSRPHGARRGGLGQVNSAGRDVAEYNLERKRTVFNVFGWLAEAARG